MKATKKQINYILLLLQRFPPERVVEITQEYDMDNLTKEEASKLISILKKESENENNSN